MDQLHRHFHDDIKVVTPASLFLPPSTPHLSLLLSYSLRVRSYTLEHQASYVHSLSISRKEGYCPHPISSDCLKRTFTSPLRTCGFELLSELDFNIYRSITWSISYHSLGTNSATQSFLQGLQFFCKTPRSAFPRDQFLQLQNCFYSHLGRASNRSVLSHSTPALSPYGIWVLTNTFASEQSLWSSSHSRQRYLESLCMNWSRTLVS